MAQLSDFTYRARFTFDVQGEDKVQSALKGVAREQENANKSTEHGDRANKFYSQSLTRLEGSLISQMRATDKVARAELDLLKTRSRLQALADKGGVVTESHIKLLNHYETALRKAAQAENDNVRATDNMVAALMKWQKGQFTATLDAWTAGLKRAKDAAEATAVANRALTESMAKNMTGLMSGYGGRTDVTGRMGAFSGADAARRAQDAAAADAALRGSLVSGMSGYGGRDRTAITMGLAAAEDRTRKLTAAMDANASAGRRMAEGLSAVGKKAAESSDFIARMGAGSLAGAGGQGLTKMQRLTVQQTFGDVVSSLATGQSPQTILLQQGEQFLQPFGTGMEGIKNAASKLGPILLRLVLNPITLIAAAAGSAAYAFDRWKGSQNELIVSLNGVGRAAGATLTQINAIAERVGDRSGISSASARSMAGTFLGAGVQGRDLAGGMGLVTDFSKRLGMDPGDAAKQIAGAIADPARGAAELAKQYGVLTYAQQEQIRALTATGQKSEATAKLIDYLGQSLSKMQDTTGFFTRQWEAFTKVVSDATDGFGQFIERMIFGSKSFAQVAEEIRNAADALKQKEADLAAGRLSGLIGQYAPDSARLKSLQEQNAQAQKDIGNSRAMTQLWQDGTAAADAVDALTNQLKNFKTQAQITAEQTATNVAVIKEENLLRKAQLQGAQLYRDEMRDSGIEANAAAKNMGAVSEALAQISKATIDLERQARNQLDLAGKSSIEQQFLRLEQEGDEQARQGIFSKKAFNDRVKAVTKQYQYDTFGSPMQDIEGQMRQIGVKNADLGKSTYSTAFDTAYMEKYNQFMKDNVEITPQAVELINRYADAQGNLAKAIEDSNRLQENFVAGLDIVRSTTKDLGESLVNAFRRGESAIEAMRGVLDRLTSKLLDKTLDMAIDGFLGKMGTAQTGSAGGMIGSLMKLLPFANGGVMTSAGPMPLMAYAGGGVANRPQLAMFGEGSRPEAYVPLPDGRNIPVKMQGQQGGAKVTVNNYSGAKVETRQMSDGEILVVVGQMVDQKMKTQVPGILANNQRRSM